jgi:NAD(P)H-hydrate epimerase
VLVGPGLKGLVGMSVARQLHQHGGHVTVCRARAAYAVPTGAAPHPHHTLMQHHYHAKQLWADLGGKECHVGTLPVSPVTIIVDALLGLGWNSQRGGAMTNDDVITRHQHATGLSVEVATLVEWANKNGGKIVSVDVPTGVEADTGESCGLWAQAQVTVALGLPKPGLVPDKTGELFLADVGLPRVVYEKAGVYVKNTHPNNFSEKIPTEFSWKEKYVIKLTGHVNK